MGTMTAQSDIMQAVGCNVQGAAYGSITGTLEERVAPQAVNGKGLNCKRQSCIYFFYVRSMEDDLRIMAKQKLLVEHFKNFIQQLNQN